MKAKIHPKYYENATITCACGNVFHVGSTVEKIDIEICSNCHPFYTGKKKLVDSAGQVDRFQKKMAAAEKFKKEQATKAKEAKKTKAPKAKKKSANSKRSTKNNTSDKKEATKK